MNLATRKRRNRWIPWLMVLPLVLIRATTTIYPIFQTFINSFRDLNIIKGGVGDFCGLSNYIAMFQDDKILASLEFTLIFTVISMAFHIILGIALALMLNMKFSGRRFLRTITLIPWAIPLIVAARAARWGFNGTYGFVNDLISRLSNVPFLYDWLVHVDSARAAVILVDLWKDVPFFAILVLAALQFISNDIYEAARIDGAHVIQIFFRITWPSIRKTVMTISIFFTMWRITSFELVYGMTSGGPYNSTSVLSYRVMTEAFNNLNLGYASAIAVVLFLILVVLTVLNLAATRRLDRK